MPARRRRLTRISFRPFPGFTLGAAADQLGPVRLQRARDERPAPVHQRPAVPGAPTCCRRSQDNSSAFHSGATNRTYLLKPQDANDTDAEYSPSEFDARHRFNASEIWELPFGRDRRWLQVGRAVAAVLGDWTVASIWTFQTGFPYNVFDGADPCLRAGGYTARAGPNLVGDPNTGARTAAQWFNTARLPAHARPASPAARRATRSAARAW